MISLPPPRTKSLVIEKGKLTKRITSLYNLISSCISVWDRFGLSPNPQINSVQEEAAPEILRRLGGGGGWDKAEKL